MGILLYKHVESTSMKFNQYLILTVMAVITFTANAKPTQFYKPYKNTNTVENIQPKKYLIESVSVNLSNKVNAPSFLTQDQIEERYLQNLKNELKSKGLLADELTTQPISLSFEIKQKRVFAGEDLKFLDPDNSKYQIFWCEIKLNRRRIHWQAYKGQSGNHFWFIKPNGIYLGTADAKDMMLYIEYRFCL